MSCHCQITFYPVFSCFRDSYSQIGILSLALKPEMDYKLPLLVSWVDTYWLYFCIGDTITINYYFSVPAIICIVIVLFSAYSVVLCFVDLI